MLPSLRDEYSHPIVERRRSQRYEFSTPIEIKWCGKKFWGRVRNISRHGMFIALPDLPVLNASFTAYLALNLPLKIECVVNRVVPGQGIGVTVTQTTSLAKARYEALLMALAIDSNANQHDEDQTAPSASSNNVSRQL
jgi:hypothetical protein